MEGGEEGGEGGLEVCEEPGAFGGEGGFFFEETVSVGEVGPDLGGHWDCSG